MNKELFVSSTPHESKVGLVEDDLLAEIYLERENEYTLAGSIYKGRVTRVLPGMQSAFVDIGLERDAFLYVSDFMDLEEHDDDLTDVVPANRGVQDMRQQGAPVGPAESADGSLVEVEGQSEAQESGSDEGGEENQAQVAGENAEPSNGGDARGDRGAFRGGRRRRRGGRRERFERSNDRGSDRGNDRSGESRYSRPAETLSPRQSGPPAGYQPILLPGESISKYQRFSPQAAVEEHEPHQSVESSTETLDADVPLAATFPEDEPIFAASETEAVAEPVHEHEHEQQEEIREAADEPVESASTSANWNREFRRSDEVSSPVLDWAPEVHKSLESQTEVPAQVESVRESDVQAHEYEGEEEMHRVSEISEPHSRPAQAPEFAAPGTMEEETIEDEEADTVHYESSADDGYDEFEEETHAAGQPEHLNGDAREAVSEIHDDLMAESGIVQAPEVTPAEGEEDSEELELEEAQAQAEALLDAEARGNGTVDARAEVRAPAATAGYTQRSQRRERHGYERRGGDRGRRGGGGGPRRFRRRESAPVPLISDLLKEGQEILVQIAKEPIGKKGARITSHIALPGRFLVYMPTVNHTGVSRKISSEEERQRLKRIILSERENGHGGFIVRTAAQSATEDELRADIRFLKGLWQDIKNRAEASKPPALIYHDLNVVERVLRDQVTADFNVIWVDTESEYERILRFFNRFQPNMVKRVKLYTKETPLFDQFGLTEEMNKALKSKVWLKSGGYIVINQTEALVAIDINTGKYVGKTQRLEDTIVKTNVDAIKEIVRQIRLRDLGGIIIIDFIDMDERRNRQRVMQALEEELRHDRAPSKTLQFNDFGLVAITRKRVKQSLERTIGAPCPYCQSTGYVKSVTTICNEIYVEMRKIAKHLEHEDVMLRVHPDVAKELKGNNARLLNEMEEMTKRTIIVKSDPAVHQEQFDIN
ncbi:MAG TPA: Rne/Rng family ribonuclease [Candidatus Eisenbacteria bacterium]|nr:Rne/Rng family ribonuclease [Candidatus Eisenbacteria bacterium]